MEEKERIGIAKEAKQILDKFAKALEKVEFKGKSEKKEIGGFREEGEGLEGDPEFRKSMFENAPEEDGEFIIAERKKW